MLRSITRKSLIENIVMLVMLVMLLLVKSIYDIGNPLWRSRVSVQFSGKSLKIEKEALQALQC